MRGLVGAALGVTQYALALRVCRIMAEKLDDFSPSQLVDVLRALGVGVSAAPELPGTAQPAPGAVSVTVQLMGPSGVESVPLDAGVTAPPRLIEGRDHDAGE